MIAVPGWGAMAALTVLLSASAAAAGMVRHGPAEPIAGLILSGGKIIAEVVTPGGVAFRRVGLRNGVPVLYRAPEFSLQVAERRPEMLPDGIVSEGGKDISAAWLTGPTRRYDHGVLGDGVEAYIGHHPVEYLMDDRAGGRRQIQSSRARAGESLRSIWPPPSKCGPSGRRPG